MPASKRIVSKSKKQAPPPSLAPAMPSPLSATTRAVDQAPLNATHNILPVAPIPPVSVVGSSVLPSILLEIPAGSESTLQTGAKSTVTASVVGDLGFDCLEDLEESTNAEISNSAKNTDTRATCEDGAFGEDEDSVIGVIDMEPLALSFFNAVMDSPHVPGHDKSMAANMHAENPCYNNTMPDFAKYWVTAMDEVVIIRLPCLVDNGVPGIKFGCYFDLYGEKITDDKFRKLRATFGFSAETYSEEAMKAASEVQRLLYRLFKKSEKSLQNDMVPPRNVSPFFKTGLSDDRYWLYLVKTDSLFATAAAPQAEIYDLSDDDNDSASNVFSSPSKFHAKVVAKNKKPENEPELTARSSTKADGFLLRDWCSPSDPTSLYYQWIGNRSHLWDSRFNIPEIRDSNGVLVLPNQWEDKLPHMTPVTVDFAMKLWTIPANPALNRQASRFYQLVLRKIQIHPCHTFAYSIKTPVDAKGKQKANDNEGEEDDAIEWPATPSRLSKKGKIARSDDIDMET